MALNRLTPSIGRTDCDVVRRARLIKVTVFSDTPRFDAEGPSSADEGAFALPMADYEGLTWLAKYRKHVNDDVRREALAAFLPAFEERYAQRLNMRQANLTARIGVGDGMLKEIQTRGCALAALSDASRRRIRELTVPMAARMHESLDLIEAPRFENGHIRLDPAEHADIFEAVSDAFEETGLLAALSAYSSKRLRLGSLGLQVNTAKETRARYGELDRSGLPERATTYLHVDSNDWPCVKALLYLSDVGPDQGPFRYVVSSHQLMGPFEAAVRKTNDKLRHSPVVLCALPSRFAQHANFGDYVDPAAPDVRRLLEREDAVCDGRSDVVLFDNNGVHRGGFVRDGYRYMLQCMFVRTPKP